MNDEPSTEPVIEPTVYRQPYIVHCGDCQHEWPAAYLPMSVPDFCKVVGHAYCPMCASRRVFIGYAKVKAKSQGT